MGRLNVIDDAAERFTAEIGRQSGVAAEGLGPVCPALRHGAVETMIIGHIEDATMVADEALPLLAISVGASLVRCDERIAPADGIGAVHRYAPTLH
jgi:peptide chain release factor subunit 1